jgi:hypothetical protein
MVQFITKASWGVTVRRVAELFMRPMPIFAMLVIPLVLTLPHLFPWLGARHPAAEPHKEARRSTRARPARRASPVEEARGSRRRSRRPCATCPSPTPSAMEKAEEGAERAIVEHKRFYLNKKFFLARLIALPPLWSWLAQRYFGWSTEQDKTQGAREHGVGAAFAPGGMMIFA